MIVATPVTEAGLSAAAWGKAHWIGVADVEDGQVRAWQIHEVGWDVSHDEGTHGSHHARIARFLLDEQVGAVVAGHMGPPMVRMLTTMKLRVLLGAQGPLDEALLRAAG